MARTKTNSATSSDEKIVEVAETTNETIETKVDTSKEVETKVETKKLNENKNVTIINPKLQYRSVRMNMKMYEFDDKGSVTVSGKEAEEFLKLSGFSIVK